VEAEQVEMFDFNTFAVKIDMDDGTSFDLECVVDKDEMDCDGETDDGTNLKMGWTLED
jgi:hypothetical protein